MGGTVTSPDTPTLKGDPEGERALVLSQKLAGMG